MTFEKSSVYWQKKIKFENSYTNVRTAIVDGLKQFYDTLLIAFILIDY